MTNRRADSNGRAGANDRPADPFKALGNETRLEILRTLYERMQGDEAPLSYSALRDRVGVADKGNFNYHLRQLDGRFLEDDGDGYRLTFAGFEIAKVIDVDAWRSHEACGPVVLEDGSERGTVCDSDGGDESLTAVYEDSVVKIRRGDETLSAHAVRPAGATDRGMAMDALLDVASTLWQHTIESILEGICPYCHATVERRLAIDESSAWVHSFRATCTTCGPLGGSHVAIAAVVHPAVISFCWERGVDVTTRPHWELPFVDDAAVTVASEEPTRLRVDVELEGDRLEVLLDETVSVVGTNRREKR
ncbi:winged helix-turn-helix domain-containing protein [Natrarchaeobius oligotrophus]|uniref:ArsR family transcriptional regulator n=1 Tax=Natrarchaeobius chitinivorans TaxID=1679083 RepID=A0A3N6PUE8_NATCH|nr:winged helix-turn-helix domain-containing protein [Natrarchaeobius chitinivorans]RQH03396.1 ArsR family transcriptional regulator [Natrarchaeobius chitinivorans]